MKIEKLLSAVLVAGGLTACSPSPKGTAQENDGLARTAATEKLLTNLKGIAAQGTMFGHQDDTVYGIGWEDVEGASDVKAVCGDYPAVIGFDLGEIELGGDLNIDKVPFARIHEEIVNQYARGGMVTLSWHARNPLTGGDAWDVSDSTAVRSILPGGTEHAKFSGWLSTVAGFLNTLQTPEGEKIPVLFRPWHEHTGSWFWWGAALCTAEDYKALWRMTADTLQAHGVDNVLYAYSPGTEPQDTLQYLARYPGDDLVDVTGFDAYQFGEAAGYTETMEHMLSIVESVAEAHGKVPAISETGYEAIPDAQWWTGTLLPIVERHQAAYLLVWRNAREKVGHYYGPYPDEPSAEDFKAFYASPKTLFAADVNSLYK